MEGQPIVSRRDDPDNLLKLLVLKEIQIGKVSFWQQKYVRILQETPTLSREYSNWLKNTHGGRNDPNFVVKQATFDEKSRVHQI